MHRLLLYIMLLQVALADDLPPVSAYIGESVTLRSGADPSWELSSITWSILANTTWIATYFGNTINVNHFYKYQRRLKLDNRTGDLVIEHLKSEDEMEYTVDFFNSQRENKVNKIKLNIKQHLRKPTIQTRLSPGHSSCLVGLHCSSLDTEVTLSWQTEVDLQHYREINNELIGIVNKTQGTVKFTCVSRKNTDSTNSTVFIKCEDPPLPVTCSTPVTPLASNSHLISRDPVFFVPGFCVGAAVVLFCMILFRQVKNSDRRTISGNKGNV